MIIIKRNNRNTLVRCLNGWRSLLHSLVLARSPITVIIIIIGMPCIEEVESFIREYPSRSCCNLSFFLRSHSAFSSTLLNDVTMMWWSRWHVMWCLMLMRLYRRRRYMCVSWACAVLTRRLWTFWTSLHSNRPLSVCIQIAKVPNPSTSATTRPEKDIKSIE